MSEQPATAARLRIGQISEAFEALLELAGAERDAWLQANVANVDDRKLLSRMLRADDNRLPDFLDASVSEHADLLRSDADRNAEPEGLIGQTFGAFRLIRLLGQGGMATVFLAERVGADFDQRVAVKLLRRGLFSSVEQSQFRRERRLLAQLHHPNIAHLIDGGVSAAGIPYLVMEYVDGFRLDDYVRRNAPSERDRLSLFVTVCRAVEAAHQALIVHRDIKPSNILVTHDGNPKLLDFGIAKLLPEDGADLQRTLTAGLTPAYAAPEQFIGAPVTTATDIYSLGIVLHELITGRRPVLQDHDLEPVASRAQRGEVLRGDLRNIVAQALAPEPSRRYASVSALIEDVENYLCGRVVRAHPPSRRYRIGKFLRRHRAAAALVFAFSTALLVASGVAIWQARAARAEAARANAVRDFLVSIFETAEAEMPRSARATPEEVIGLGAERVLVDAQLPPVVRAELMAVLARVALSMGSDEQSRQLTKALMTTASTLFDVDDSRWIEARVLHARAMMHAGEYEQAIALLAPQRATWERRADPAAFQGLSALREALLASGAHDEEAVRLAASIRARALEQSQDFPEVAFAALISEADVFQAQHRFQDALARSDAALEFWKTHQLPLTNQVLWLYQGIGNAASSLGDVERGEAAYRDAIRLSEQLYAGPHRDTAWFVGLLGSYLVSLGRLEEAEPYVMRGLAMRRDLLGATHVQTIFALNSASRLRMAQGRNKEALAFLDEAVDACDPLPADAEPCARALASRGRLLGIERRFAEARRDLDTAIELRVARSGTDSPMLASQLVLLAELQRRQGQYEDAIAVADRALKLMDRGGGGHWADVAVARLQRAWARLEIGLTQAALDEIVEAEAVLAQQSPAQHVLRFDMAAVRARALSRLGRDAEAAVAARLALAAPDQPSSIDLAMRRELDRLAKR